MGTHEHRADPGEVTVGAVNITFRNRNYFWSFAYLICTFTFESTPSTGECKMWLIMAMFILDTHSNLFCI